MASFLMDHLYTLEKVVENVECKILPKFFPSRVFKVSVAN